MDAEVIDRDAQLPSDISEAVDSSLAIGLSRAEIDTQIATARRFPRQLTRVSSSILSLATLDEETAEESMYALPRGGKPIQGPSIRFAEIVKSSYGNCRAAARVVHVDRIEKVVIAEGVFHDLETNTATRAEVRRRIVDRQGRIYKDDMIIVTGNAACSIALRNAILGGVPKALWRKAYEAVQHTIAGDTTTLSVTREKAIKALAHFGVTPDQVYQALGVAGIDDITVQHIPTLRGMFATLKNGEATVEEMFVGTVPAKSSSGHEKVDNPLADEPPAKKTNPETSHDPIPPSDHEAEPASVAATSDAGSPNQEPSANAPADDGEVQSSETGNSGAALPSPLPKGWEAGYIAALKRAQKVKSLESYAKQFWQQNNVDWNSIAFTDDGKTASQIYKIFTDNFGRPEIIEQQLREIV